LGDFFIEAERNARTFGCIFLDGSGGTNDKVILPSGKPGIAINPQAAFPVCRDIC
jgi:hypothetical protein